MYKILGSRWFSNSTGCIGIVAVETFQDEWKAYIGVVAGDNLSADEQVVAARGTGLPPDQASVFFPFFDTAKYKKE